MRYYMFNKPRGCVSACSDARCKTVMDYFPEDEREGLFPVGRLDKDTEGFLIITDDGSFCYRINTPSFLVEKTYRFFAKGNFSEEKLLALEGGVSLKKNGGIVSAPAKAKYLGKSTMREISSLVSDDEKKLKYTRKGDVEVTHCSLTVTEGKKHQVKKMAAAVGLYIVYLERIAIGGVNLDKNLKRGEYRPLTEIEIKTLLKENNS